MLFRCGSTCLLEQRNLLLQLHIERFTNRLALQEFVPCMFTQDGNKSLPLLLHRLQGQQFRRVATRIYFEQVAAVYVSAVKDVFLGKGLVRWMRCYSNKTGLKTQLLRKVVSTRYSE